MTETDPPRYIDFPGSFDTPTSQIVFQVYGSYFWPTPAHVALAEQTRKLVADSIANNRFSKLRMGVELFRNIAYYKVLQILAETDYTTESDQLSIIHNDKWSDSSAGGIVGKWLDGALVMLIQDVMETMVVFWSSSGLASLVSIPGDIRENVYPVRKMLIDDYKTNHTTDRSALPAAYDLYVVRPAVYPIVPPRSPLREARRQLMLSTKAHLPEPVDRPAWRPSPLQLKRARAPSRDQPGPSRLPLAVARARSAKLKRPHPLSVLASSEEDEASREELGEATDEDADGAPAHKVTKTEETGHEGWSRTLRRHHWAPESVEAARAKPVDSLEAMAKAVAEIAEHVQHADAGQCASTIPPLPSPMPSKKRPGRKPGHSVLLKLLSAGTAEPRKKPKVKVATRRRELPLRIHLVKGTFDIDEVKQQADEQEAGAGAVGGDGTDKAESIGDVERVEAAEGMAQSTCRESEGDVLGESAIAAADAASETQSTQPDSNDASLRDEGDTEAERAGVEALILALVPELGMPDDDAFAELLHHLGPDPAWLFGQNSPLALGPDASRPLETDTPSALELATAAIGADPDVSAAQLDELATLAEPIDSPASDSPVVEAADPASCSTPPSPPPADVMSNPPSGALSPSLSATSDAPHTPHTPEANPETSPALSLFDAAARLAPVASSLEPLVTGASGLSPHRAAAAFGLKLAHCPELLRGVACKDGPA
ncbi:hypothetical protein Q5752_003059 [Cryptotrichosporon argae]